MCFNQKKKNKQKTKQYQLAKERMHYMKVRKWNSHRNICKPKDNVLTPLKFQKEKKMKPAKDNFKNKAVKIFKQRLTELSTDLC